MPSVPYSRYVNRYSDRYRKYTLNGQLMELITSPKLIGQEAKIGVKDSDWRVKVAKHQNAGTAYTNRTWEYVVPHYHRATGISSNASGDQFHYDVTNLELSFHGDAGIGTTDNALRDLALARLKRKLSGKLGGANLLVPVVELREMRGLIRTLAESATKFIKAFATVRKTGGKSVHRLMQDMWLTWSFAIAPLIGDTIAAAEAIAKYLDLPTDMHRIRGTASKRWLSGRHIVSGSSAGWGWDTQVAVVNNLQYTYTAGIDFSLITGNNYGMMEHLGFTDIWGQLPSVAWELMPFSWVFDYFTTMGAFLEDTFELPSGSTKYLTLSRKYTAELDEFRNLVENPNQVGYMNFILMNQVSLPGHLKYVDFDRTVLTSLPHRALRIKSLDEIGVNAVNRLLNLCSLVKRS